MTHPILVFFYHLLFCFPVDRPDAGYSPLWQVFWVTELPLNYSADQISNADQFTEANGAKVFIAPMWVNCPNVGTVGTTKNPTKKESFELAIDRSNGDESNFLLGSDSTLIFKGDMPISFFGSVDDTAFDTAFDTTTTNAAGAFQYELVNKNIPATATDVIVKFKEALLGSSFEVTGVVTGADYITALPVSIYEDPVKSPQNSDYDTEKKMFAAHSGWYNDYEVHYYKFRM